MDAKMTDPTLDKTMRSVFVGNIPYEVTEERLKEIFSEVGPVISFKLVFDRESGKPKGYGFCEYKDPETAMSAMRNLNNYEISGRTLRVDNACTEKSRLEMQSLMQGNTPVIQSRFGEPVSSEKAPEVISNTVATLPPDLLLEIMKQMKQYVINTPSESRDMLMQYPQLAYALLQGLVVMRMVDPQTAAAMLLPTNPILAPIQIPTTTNSNPPPTLPQRKPEFTFPAAYDQNAWTNNSAIRASMNLASQPVFPMQPPPVPTGPIAQDMDLRTPRSYGDQDMRLPPTHMIPATFSTPNDTFASRDPRLQPSTISPADPRNAYAGIRNTGLPTPTIPPTLPQTKYPVIPGPLTTNSKIPKLMLNTGSDSEKAALIMQVLSLTDEQMANFPAEQRMSIQVLRETMSKQGAKRTT